MKSKTETNDLDLRRLWRGMKRAWWLYAGTFIIMMTMATIYVLFRMPQYDTYATMLIENSSSTSSLIAAASQKSSAAAKMLNLGSADTANEMQLLTSHDVMAKVIREAGLNYTYVERDGLEKKLLYPSAPIAAQVPQTVLDTLQSGIKIRVHIHDGKADLEVKKGPKGILTGATAENVTLPYDFHTHLINVRILPTGTFRPDEDRTIDVIVMGTEPAIKDLRKELSIEEADKKSDAIGLRLRGPSRQRDQAVLTLMMETYNQKRLARRRETAAMEVDYCNDRLETLLKQLSESEHRVEDFKRQHNTMAMKVDSAGWITKSIGSRVETSKAQNELTYYDQLLYTLQKDKDHNAFLPASFDGEKNALADQYNDLVTRKHELERSATDDNPALRSINQQLEEMRSTLIGNFSQNVELARANLQSVLSLRSEAQGEMQQVPALERELFDLMRDKYIKNEIYLYLLQRREAAELQLYATDTYGFVVDTPFSDVKPIPTRDYLAYVIALLLSVILPTLVVLFFMRRRDALRQPMDTAFIGLEGNTLNAADGGVASLRSRILSSPDTHTIYVTSFVKDSTLASDLADSLTALGSPAVTIRPADIVEGNDSADVYLTRAARGETERLRGEYEYVIAVAPDVDKLNTMAAAVDAEGAMLVVEVSGDKTRRSQLRRALRGQMAEHVTVYII